MSGAPSAVPGPPPSAVPGRPPSTVAERRTAELAVLAVTVLWGGNFIVVKAATVAFPPIGFAFIRFAIAALTLLLVLRWREGSVGIPRRDIVPLAILGAVGFGVYQMLWPTALRFVSAGDSALLIAATPIFTALLAVVAGSDTLTVTKLAGVLLSLAGVAVVIAGGTGLSLGASLVGDLLTLAAALCWAIYTAFGAPILRRHSPLRTTTWAMVFGAIALLPLGVAQLATTSLDGIEAGVGAAVLYSAFLSAGVSNVVVFHAVRLLGPTRITAFQFLVPAVAVVLAAIFLAEPILPAQVLGGVVIVAGILLTRSGRGFRPRPARAPA
ncbi:MAG TPA: DMT family transporter [Candidatus Limnocylindrales bacterium]|nr:DMT family transporter [Candidatus Limnocylindrales bacterium]